MSRLDLALITPMLRAFQNDDPSVTSIRARCPYWLEQPYWLASVCGQLSFAIAQNSTIQELELVGFPADMCSAVAEALKHNFTLQRVEIYDAGGGDAVGICFAEAMRHNTTLRSLQIAWVSEGFEGVGDGTCAALAETLRHNSTLENLGLAGEFSNTALQNLLDCAHIGSLTLDIHDDGTDAPLVAVALGMKSNTTVTHLTLASKFIGNRALAAIAEALRNNRTLVSLTLRVEEMLNGDLISDTIGMMLAEALKQNIALNSLTIHGPASLVKAFPLAGVLKHNPILQLVHLTVWSPPLEARITLDTAVLEALQCNQELPSQWHALACTARPTFEFSLSTLSDVIIRTQVLSYFLPPLCTLRARWPKV